MTAGRLKFAVVREDPELECSLITSRGYGSALVVASGGCTALTLAARFPGLRVAAFDINPLQLGHVVKKQEAARRGEVARLNVGDSDISGLNQCGAFEGLFRILRTAVAELVSTEEEILQFFGGGNRAEILARWTASRYWQPAFETAFNEPLLLAMFGPDATQHAARGSYPAYFRRVFERGLGKDGAAHNPFLQHVFLGQYRQEDAPEYVRAEGAGEIDLIKGTLFEVPGVDSFDLYSLSNVFDWSNDAQIAAWADTLSRAARPGSAVLIRQLNNRRDVRRFFGSAFEFDDRLGREMVERDRSLFYENIEVGFRCPIASGS